MKNTDDFSLCKGSHHVQPQMNAFRSFFITNQNFVKTARFWFSWCSVTHNIYSYNSLESIGLFEVSIDTLSLDSFKDLFSTIVPSAVFVAVMALQLKYFSPNEGTTASIRGCPTAKAA